jgi:hypothetical protein
MQEMADSSALKRQQGCRNAILPRKSGLSGGCHDLPTPARDSRFDAGTWRPSRLLDFDPTRSYLTAPERVLVMRGIAGA